MIVIYRQLHLIVLRAFAVRMYFISKHHVHAISRHIGVWDACACIGPPIYFLLTLLLLLPQLYKHVPVLCFDIHLFFFNFVEVSLTWHDSV